MDNKELYENLIYLNGRVSVIEGYYRELTDKIKYDEAVYDNMTALSLKVNEMNITIKKQQETIYEMQQQIADLQTKLAEHQAEYAEHKQNTNASIAQLQADDQQVRTDMTALSATNLQNAKNYTNNEITAFQNRNPKIAKLNNMCKLLYQLCYNAQTKMTSYTTNNSDGNGFIRYNGVNNDTIVAVAPYDSRVSTYECCVVGWSDYQNDNSTNIHAKWIGSWGNCSNIRYRIWSCGYINVNYTSIMNSNVSSNNIEVPP